MPRNHDPHAEAGEPTEPGQGEPRAPAAEERSENGALEPPGELEPSGEAEDGRVARAREQRKQRRDRILRAAQRIFAERGYHAASIADVIDAAGTSRGTFYLYFDSKRAIFDELLDDLFGKLKRCVRPVDLSPGAPSPLDQLRANVTCAMKVVAENLDLTRMLYRAGQGIDAELDRKLAAFNAAVTELIGRALRRGMEIGIVRPLDDDLVAHCVYGSVKEIVFHSLETNRFEEKPLPSIVDEILRYNLNGLLES
jgi:AcrR family transcriptional regulator